jgi:two-component system, cell cycle response regulator DivK
MLNMNGTVLVAEDDPRNRKLIRDILLIKGCEVLEAENGRAAVALAKENRPGLILLDIQMPIMDGFEAVAALKADPNTAMITTWALTSYAMPGDEEKIRRAGCDDYITKPIDVPVLVEKVEQHFADLQGA